MPFKKLNLPLLETLERFGFEEPLPFQKKVISKVKSGVNLFGIAPKGSGKTTAMIISTIQKLESAAFEDAPRALIFVKDKQAAQELADDFKEYARYMDLRVYAAYEGPDIENQKLEVYEGMDVVIGTPTGLHKLFLISGLNLSQMKLVVVEDAEFLVSPKHFTGVIGVTAHMPKTQYLVFATGFNSKMERLKELFMEHSETVRLK